MICEFWVVFVALGTNDPEVWKSSLKSSATSGYRSLELVVKTNVSIKANRVSVKIRTQFLAYPIIIIIMDYE